MPDCSQCNAQPTKQTMKYPWETYEEWILRMSAHLNTSQYVPPLNTHLNTSNALQEAGANAVAGGFQPDVWGATLVHTSVLDCMPKEFRDSINL